jgi:hypothetical protein
MAGGYIAWILRVAAATALVALLGFTFPAAAMAQERHHELSRGLDAGGSAAGAGTAVGPLRPNGGRLITCVGRARSPE